MERLPIRTSKTITCPFTHVEIGSRQTITYRRKKGEVRSIEIDFVDDDHMIIDHEFSDVLAAPANVDGEECFYIEDLKL